MIQKMQINRIHLEKLYQRPAAILPTRITCHDLVRTMQKSWDRSHDIDIHVFSSLDDKKSRTRKAVIEVLPTFFGHPEARFKDQESYLSYMADMAFLLNSEGVSEQVLCEMKRSEYFAYVRFAPTSKRSVKITVTY